MQIRSAITHDADAIAKLCAQLGYPTTVSAVRQRLEQIQTAQNHIVYVAECPNIRVIGWVHAYFIQLLLTDLQVEIGGLVVDENYRGTGIGRQLLLQVEQWASQHGCKCIYVRSNIIRKAYVFYEKLGYRYIKTSLAFRKDL